MLTHSSRALPSRFQSFINRVSEALRAELTFKITNRNKSRKNAQRPSVGPPCGPLEKALFFLGSRRPPDVPTSLSSDFQEEKKGRKTTTVGRSGMRTKPPTPKKRPPRTTPTRHRTNNKTERATPTKATRRQQKQTNNTKQTRAEDADRTGNGEKNSLEIMFCGRQAL